jgi:hypothetical protein
MQALHSMLQGAIFHDISLRMAVSRYSMSLQAVSTGLGVCGASLVVGNVGHQPHQAAEHLGHRRRAAGGPATAGAAGEEALPLDAAARHLSTTHCNRFVLQALLGQLQDESMSANPLDGREYKMALARTRQAVAVHKAMQFNAQGSPARCAAPQRQSSCLALRRQPAQHMPCGAKALV